MQSERYIHSNFSSSNEYIECIVTAPKSPQSQLQDQTMERIKSKSVNRKIMV